MPHLTSIERLALKEGLEKGRVEGRQEGQLRVIQRQLERRLGKLSASLEERVGALNSERLECLAEALLEFRSLADLEAWLNEV